MKRFTSVAALLLALASPLVSRAGGPIVEVSCGPLTLPVAQQMFASKGATVRVEAVYGAAATSGQMLTHELKLDAGRQYFFVQTIYNAMLPEADFKQADYNMGLTVTDAKSRASLVSENRQGSYYSSTEYKKYKVSDETRIKVAYNYTANGADKKGSCLTLVLVSEPKDESVVEVSCGPMSRESFKAVFTDQGRVRVKLTAIFGAESTPDVVVKHQLTLQPGREYTFIISAYNPEGTPGGTDVDSRYKDHFHVALKVTSAEKGKVLVEKKAPADFRLNTATQTISVRRPTVVDIEYSYGINSQSDLPGTCLSLMVVDRPDK